MATIRSAGGLGAAALFALLFFAGCNSVSSQNSPGRIVGEDTSGEVVYSTLAGQFGETITVEIIDNELTSFRGQINSPGEVVTYNIGPVKTGDRLVVEVIADSEGLDPAVAIFDANEDLMVFNEDRNYYARQTNPFVRFTACYDTENCLVAVSPNTRSDSIGKYQLQITRSPGFPVEEASVQIVFLDFNGEDNVTIGHRKPMNIKPFSGSMIDERFSQQTEDIIHFVVERVRQNYSNFNVTILSSREQSRPSGAHTSIYLGNYNPAELGVADETDDFNEQKIQDAVVFVETFAIFMSQDPTLDEICNALASVTSHEIGHLLGLNHTKDPLGVMDTSGSIRQMLLPRTLRRSPLSPRDIFKVGFQNSPQMLLKTVGGDETAVLSELDAKRIYDPWYDEGPQESVWDYHEFGTACGRH